MKLLLPSREELVDEARETGDWLPVFSDRSWHEVGRALLRADGNVEFEPVLFLGGVG